MALSTEELGEIEAALSIEGKEIQAFAELRARFPHLTWTRCDASDVIESPFRSCGRFDLHLLDSSDHCSQITTDMARATGVVLALRSGKP